MASSGDHLLPRSQYPQLEGNVYNLVPACADCNHIKHYDDPSSGEGAGLDLTDDKVRQRLIDIANDQIKQKKKAHDWEGEFPNARLRFKEAVEEYRKCKESAAAA